jgi:hypothetical protein
VMLIARHARRPFAACAGGRTAVCGPEHSFLYWYEYVHLIVSWPRMASGYIICNYVYFYLWRQSRRKLSGYVFLIKKPQHEVLFSICMIGSSHHSSNNSFCSVAQRLALAGFLELPLDTIMGRSIQTDFVTCQLQLCTERLSCRQKHIWIVSWEGRKVTSAIAHVIVPSISKPLFLLFRYRTTNIFLFLVINPISNKLISLFLTHTLQRVSPMHKCLWTIYSLASSIFHPNSFSHTTISW